MKVKSTAVNLVTGCPGNNFIAKAILWDQWNISRFYPLWQPHLCLKQKLVIF